MLPGQPISLMPTSITTNPSEPDPKQNLILAALPASDYQRILPDLELVDMPLGWTLSESGDHINFLHFPISGVISLMYSLEDGSTSETALVGNEGMVGISIFMGGESMPSSTEVQNAGQAYRLSRKMVKREFDLGGKLQQLALLFTQALIAQTSQTAVCNRHHQISQQLCRWLLMTVDRLHTHDVRITQEMVAQLLGVRRETVTQAARQLHEEGLITRSRGLITVADRPQLEARACECYGVVQTEFARLFGKPASGR